jgi:hypothetical protein
MDRPWEGKDLSEGGPSARLPTALWTSQPAKSYTFCIIHSQICLMQLILISHPV